MKERLAIAGGGAIACGLAVAAAPHGGATVLVRSEESAAKARARVTRLLESNPAPADAVRVTTATADLAECTFAVEAVAEDPEVKATVLATLVGVCRPDAILATTTSSLSIDALAAASGAPERFAGLHVFNPVTRMALVELAFPPSATEETRRRAQALCDDLGKEGVVVPDMPGFVVNRLLFPYLFSAVDLLEKTGMDPADVDRCMVLGAGHPIGPLALLDFVGLDIADAIGAEIGSPAPSRVRELIAAGALGRKSGRGFYDYGER